MLAGRHTPQRLPDKDSPRSLSSCVAKDIILGSILHMKMRQTNLLIACLEQSVSINPFIPPSHVLTRHSTVDRGVTEARGWGFFIQPHACLQGTARPGHYYVILDEFCRGRAATAPLRTPADALEELTHNMCHLFG